MEFMVQGRGPGSDERTLQNVQTTYGFTTENVDLNDIIEVSGLAAPNAAANGYYARGKGAVGEAFAASDSGGPVFYPAGSNGDGDDAIYGSAPSATGSTWELYVGNAQIAYTDTVAAPQPYQIPTALWLLSDDDSPNACTVTPVNGVSTLQYCEVVGAGTAVNNGIYVRDSQTAVISATFINTTYTKVGTTYDPDNGTLIRYREDLLDIPIILNGGDGNYAGQSNRLPWDTAYDQDAGSNPVPTVTQGYNTISAELQYQQGLLTPIQGTKTYLFTGVGGTTTGVVGKNTYGVTINVTNPGTGQYRFSAASGTPFTSGGKTTVYVTVIDGSNYIVGKVTELTSDHAYIELFDTASQTGSDPTQYQITIITEP